MFLKEFLPTENILGSDLRVGDQAAKTENTNETNGDGKRDGPEVSSQR